MANPRRLIVAVMYSLLIFRLVEAGLAWGVLFGPYTCTGSIHTYMHVVAVIASCFIGMFLLLGLGACCFACFSEDEASDGCFFCQVAAFIVVSSLLNLALFIWGISLLVKRECVETPYWTFTLILVVLQGLGFLQCFSVRYYR